MQRFFAGALLLLFAFPCHAQTVIDIAKPAGILTPAGSHTVIEWFNGNPRPVPGGTWKIQNAIVHPDNTVGRWSQPVTQQLPTGWMLLGRAGNLPIERAAVVWRATHESGRTIWLRQGLQDGVGSWWTFGTPQGGYPWSGNCKQPYILIPWQHWQMPPVVELPGIEPVPPPPEIWLCNCPLNGVQVARSWVSHNGETELSPAGTMPAASTVGGIQRVIFVTSDGNRERIPEGVLGYYLYVRIDGIWRRQLTKPWLDGTAGNDKYLHSPHVNEAVLFSLHKGPEHKASPRPCSVVTPLQRAAYRGDSYTTTKQEEPLYGPVIVGYQPSKPTQVLGSDAGWRLRQTTTLPVVDGMVFPNDHPTHWPAIITQNSQNQQTILRYCSIRHEWPEDFAGRGRGISIAVTGCDYSGDQAWKFNIRDCFLKIDEFDWKWKRWSIHIGWECAGKNGHTPSEWRYRDNNLSPVNIEGDQSVNHNFATCNMQSLRLCKCAARLRDVVMSGGDGQVIFDMGSHAMLHVNGLFIDRPCLVLLDCNGVQHRELNISDIDSVCGSLYFVRSPLNQARHKIVFGNWPYWRPDSRPAYLYSSLKDVLDTRTDGSDVLSGKLTVIQPKP